MEVEDAEVPEWRGQQTPPCGDTPAQVVLNDACWMTLEARPPCGDLYEHEGRCHVPVAETKRLPTRVGE
ncbi:hypothetical protein [Melittangium boletus]|uniref:hypothetical protein n=1 Tax=Melittangium boletus TaxID=83453 RepID=UPI003DA4756B